MNEFYVYEHYDMDGNVFYVGKGKGDRAWSKDSRSRFWKRYANKHGLHVRIVSDKLSEDEAFDLEKDLIAEHGRRDQGTGTLVNLTDGGEGVVNLDAHKVRREWNERLEAEGLGVFYVSQEERSSAKFICYDEKRFVPAKSEHEVYGEAFDDDSMLEVLSSAMTATSKEAEIADRRRGTICGLDDYNRPRSLRIKRKHREPGKDWRKRINDHILHTYA